MTQAQAFTGEVTVDQFDQFAKETGHRTDAERGDGCFTLNSRGDSYELRKDVSWRKPGYAQLGTHPVVCVSFRDVQAFIAWLNLRSGEVYRLPTEAEWEFGARSGATTRFSFGDDLDTTLQCGYANGADRTLQAQPIAKTYAVARCDDKYPFTSPAGALKPNRFGLYGMHGNVLEWVQDCYHEDYSGAPADGSAWMEQVKGDCSRRVLRGGSWSNVPRVLRSAFRGGVTVDGAIIAVGFRLARTL